MRRKWYLACLLSCVFMMTAGMGDFGQQRSIEAPEPDTLYSATLIDQDDVSMEINKLSCNGQTYIFGYMGRSQVSIDFNKIRAILFLLKEDKLRADINLSNGNTVEIMVEGDIPWQGVSTFADVRIDTKDIKKIVLHGQTVME